MVQITNILSPPPVHPTPALPVPEKEQKKWSVSGRINNKIVITDGNQERLVENGDSIGNCIVMYPEILCGEKKEDNVKNLIEVNDGLKNRISEIQVEMRKKGVEIEKKTAEYESLLSKFNISSNEVKGLNEIVTRKKDQINSIVKEKNEIENIIAEKDNEIAMLKAKIKKLNNLLNTESAKKQTKMQLTSCRNENLQLVGNILICNYGSNAIAIKAAPDRLQVLELLLRGKTYERKILQDKVVFIVSKKEVGGSR